MGILKRGGFSKRGVFFIISLDNFKRFYINLNNINNNILTKLQLINKSIGKCFSDDNFISVILQCDTALGELPWSTVLITESYAAHEQMTEPYSYRC